MTWRMGIWLWMAITPSIATPLYASDRDSAPTLLFLSDQGPLVVQLQITVGGLDHVDAWHAFVDRMFQDLDQDRDGALRGKEISDIPSPTELRQMGVVTGTTQNLPAVSADSNPRDGVVTRDELADYLMRVGAGPFSLNTTPQRQQVIPGYGPMGATAEDHLFERLDADNDGKLSADDFQMTDALRKLDLDDDGTLSLAELQPVGAIYVEAADPYGRSASPPASPFFYLDDALSPAAQVRQIVDRYDGQAGGVKDGRLTREEMGLDQQSFARLDADANGELDFDELRQFLRQPAPDVHVTVRLGRLEDNKPRVEIAAERDLGGVLLRSVDANTASLVIGKVRIEVAADSSWGGDSMVYKQQFRTLDTDNNGYLELKEVERIPTYRQAFSKMDRDGDGKVFEEEFVGYFERLAAASQSRVVASVSDQGNRLFDILDLNGDGRLSPHEVAGGRDKVRAWDEDGDQRISKDEIPRQWRMVIGRGSATPGVLGTAAVAIDRARPVPATNGNAGPAWFRAMDRNGDGEVTKREFLGPLADFDRLDLDGNGVLDPAEAAAR